MLVRSSASYGEQCLKLKGAVDRFLQNIGNYHNLSLAEKRLVLLSRRWRRSRDFSISTNLPLSLSAYDIVIFCQLEWLLRGLLDLNKPSARIMGLTEMWESLQPIADTCRCIYAACTFSDTARVKFLSNPTPISRNVEHIIGHRIQGLQHRNEPSSSIGLNLLERSPSALESMLDVMLEIAIFMRREEECKFPRGKSTFNLSWHDVLPYLLQEDSVSTQHVISVSSKHIHLFSNVHIYGIFCFNFLTENVPGTQKFKQLFRSISEFYDFVIKGSWKQVVHGKPEYLVRLVAWCWETDPSKRPAFSTICSLLQRAMQCLIFPPVLNLKRLSNFLQQREYNQLNLYLSFVWSHDISFNLVGTSLMGKLVKAFHSDTIEKQRFSSDIMYNKVMQLFAHINACKKDVEAMVLRHQNSTKSANLCSHSSAHSGSLISASTQASSKEDDLDCNNHLIQSLTEEVQLKSLIDIEKKFDSCSTEVLNSDVFEKHVVIFEALAYDRMLATFPPLDFQFWIRPLVHLSQHGQKLPIPRPDRLVRNLVDLSSARPDSVVLDLFYFGARPDSLVQKPSKDLIDPSKDLIDPHRIPQLVGFWEGI